MSPFGIKINIAVIGPVKGTGDGSACKLAGGGKRFTSRLWYDRDDTDMTGRCEECGKELVDKPTRNWGICEECDAKVCNNCLVSFHNDECDEEDHDQD